LALLLVHAPEPVSQDRLIDELWGERPPASAAHAVQVYVSGIRKLLRAVGGEVAVNRSESGYVLEVDSELIDGRRFERLLEEARGALADDPGRARGLFDRALSLWRGRPLAECEVSELARREAERLDELHARGIEGWAEARLACDEHGEVVGPLTGLVSANPLRERPRQLLMLALYRSGRHAEALAAYRDACAALYEIGLQPGPELRRLEEAILRHDSSLTALRVSADAAGEVARADARASVDLRVASRAEAEPGLGSGERETQRQGAPRQARKVVTVLFCDVTGSTALGEELDPEVLRGVLNRYFTEMRGIIERHGGTVEKFIGDAVVAVFGIPRVHEDDALRAVRSAALIRERLPAIAVEVGVQLRFRTGVNTGLVLSGEGENLAVGDAVNVAARLEQAAEPGEIVLGDETLRLVRDAVKVAALEPLELKGKSEPMTAYRLLEIDPAAPGVARQLDRPLVGRERELGLLRAAWDCAVQESGCHLLTLLGEAGVGKSRLVAEFLAGLGEGASVLQGRCLPYGEGITFWPLVEALMPVGEAAQALLGRLRSGGTAMPGELFWEVRRLLEGQAHERPLVLHLDDLQWAESMLLDLVDYLTDLSRGAPILVVCTARPELLEDRAGWSVGRSHMTRMTLDPLPEPDSEALLDELGATLDPNARARVIAAGAGNPLFLEEMVALARDRGKVEAPPTIQALLTARLEHLAAEEREVLERGAIEGEVFHRLALRALADEPLAAQVELRLAGLVRKELIRPHPPTFEGDEAFRFRHLLIRDAAYDGLPKAIRAALHERFARWLDGTGRELLELDEIAGWHLEQAMRYRRQLGQTIAPDIGRGAVTHLRAAGDRAFARGDMPAAANLLGRAVDLLPNEDPARPGLLVDIASALTEIGDLARAVSTFELAGKEAPKTGSAGADWRARVGLAFAKTWTGLERWRDAAALAQEAVTALTEVGDDLGVARAWNLLGLACLQIGSSRQADVALGHAIEYARRAQSLREEAQAQTWLLINTWYGATPVDQALTRCREGAAHATSRQVEAFALVEQGPLLAMQGKYRDARRLYRQGRAILDELGLQIFAAGVSQEYLDIEKLAGDLPAAEAELRRACETLERLGEKGFLSTRAACLGHVLCLQGRLEEADAFIEIAAQLASPDDLTTQVLSLSARARMTTKRGHAREATDLAEQAVTILESTDWLSTHADTLVILAEALQAANRPTDAVVALTKAVELYDQKGNLVAARNIRELLNTMTTPSA
jgi:class 3 adenylate cyclase/tetratricopeptide (TPR) repeat protein